MHHVEQQSEGWLQPGEEEHFQLISPFLGLFAGWNHLFIDGLQICEGDVFDRDILIISEVEGFLNGLEYAHLWLVNIYFCEVKRDGEEVFSVGLIPEL